jgi:hypothetical protein
MECAQAAIVFVAYLAARFHLPRPQRALVAGCRAIADNGACVLSVCACQVVTSTGRRFFLWGGIIQSTALPRDMRSRVIDSRCFATALRGYR